MIADDALVVLVVVVVVVAVVVFGALEVAVAVQRRTIKCNSTYEPMVKIHLHHIGSDLTIGSRSDPHHQ
jgi:hypothetical protein